MSQMENGECYIMMNCIMYETPKSVRNVTLRKL
jgi:hypothetical protein